MAYLRSKEIYLSPRIYFIDALGAMAFGLFASLLIGTIFGTIYDWTDIAFFGTMADYAKKATGAALGLSIAYSLRCPPLVLYTCAAVGFAGNDLGGPVGAYCAVLIAAELGKLISKETKVDIILTPAVTLASGVAMATWVGPYINKLMVAFGNLIMTTTEMHPLLMGALVAVLVGIALTLPISSAAICIMLGLTGLAGGAATAGCCAQMVGFAIMSFSDNGWGGIAAQGLGTSMLQMPNIVRRPIVWLPPILTSAVTGMLATTVFRLENIPAGAGMGTCGLVGPLGVLTAMPDGGLRMWSGIIVICFVLPALLTPLFAWPLRKLGLIREGDLLLDTGN
ncbi:MAG: PTS sugar transporter subunit IIC [Ruminococcaceae bacterium]|nr:PTS sugar transporter subunit IIC [Oscillospiraceae bacterium]